jgi:hypothetical protein
MSNAIGVGAICVTVDNFAVLMLRQVFRIWCHSYDP